MRDVGWEGLLCDGDHDPLLPSLVWCPLEDSNPVRPHEASILPLTSRLTLQQHRDGVPTGSRIRDILVADKSF